MRYFSIQKKNMAFKKYLFTADIKGPQEVIFDLVADMPKYYRWLPGSQAFGETINVNPYPVRLGTIYLDSGPAGTRPGRVTAYEFPRKITFHHTMLLKKGLISADIEVKVNCHFQMANQITTIERTIDLQIQMSGLGWIFLPFIRYSFIVENRRILRELKKYVERL
jgi:hypothetical protein